MKKKWYFLLILVILCAVLLPTKAAAADIASGTYGSNLTWVLDDSGTLTITGIGEMKGEKNESIPWASYKLQIKKVVIGEGVTSVASGAFSDYKVIKEVSFPSTMITIGDSAFRDCARLQRVVIPESATACSSTFSDCDALKEAIVYGTLSGMYTFGNCDALERVELGEKNTTIPYGAFIQCPNLTEVVFPDTLTAIAASAFERCYKIRSVTIPSSVTSIGDMAFYNCSGVEAVYITDLEAWCNIEFTHSISDGTNPLTWGNGMLYLNGQLVEELVIPESITTVNKYAFEGCDSLKSLTIPGWVDVEPRAFQGCKNLETIVVSEGVSVLKEGVFSFCTGLKEITLPASLSVVLENAFKFYSDYDNKRPQVLETVNYAGTSDQWKEITILKGNEQLTTAYQQTNCSHTWESTGVTQQPTCKEEGKEQFRCSLCDKTKETAIPILATHTWNGGSITKDATCAEEGVMTYTCTVCSSTKTEVVAKLDIHTYDHNCDVDCNVCGETRNIDHSYGAGWSSDNDGHWQVCVVCSYQQAEEEHIPNTNTPGSGARYCTVCGVAMAEITEPETQPSENKKPNKSNKTSFFDEVDITAVAVAVLSCFSVVSIVGGVWYIVIKMKK